MIRSGNIGPIVINLGLSPGGEYHEIGAGTPGFGTSATYVFPTPLAVASSFSGCK